MLSDSGQYNNHRKAATTQERPERERQEERCATRNDTDETRQWQANTICFFRQLGGFSTVEYFRKL